MKIYTVHKLAWSPEDDGEAVFIKEGFCWPGAVFGLFWALWHGMWAVAAGLFGIAFLLGFVGEMIGLAEAFAGALQLMLHFAVGVFGNDLRRWTLRRRGFVDTSVVAAAKPREAEFRYFAALAAERGAPTPGRP